MTVSTEKYICGIDEAGRGPLAGPVVTSCVILKPGTKIEGVKDSKKLSEKKREFLFGEIINSCLEYKIEIIDNKIIDGINILNATMLGMEKCISGIKTENIRLLIDGNYFRLNDNLQEKYEYQTIVEGDDKIFEISCASILAKVTRDRLMRDYDIKYPEYLFAKNKGYGTPEHIQRILKFGLCDIHRKTFCKNFIQYTFEDFQ
ncbi:MAG: ribonuclease HII [Ignavibacteriae bacterium]|nr:ribonuclease HII [Ignavibacteriota bacterium]